jgi:hypothetical protein
MPLDSHERNIKAVLRGIARALHSRSYDIVEEPLPPSLAEVVRRLEEKRNKFGSSIIERRWRGHGELSMDRDQYFVVHHKGEWKIKHKGATRIQDLRKESLPRHPAKGDWLNIPTKQHLGGNNTCH